MKPVLGAMMLLSFCLPSQAKDLSIEDVYPSFNLRSINSSYGQRLKHYCQSYLKDYFPASSITEKTKTKMTLESGNDVWVIAILGKNKIKVTNQITKASYLSSSDYELVFNKGSADWRAKETFIDVSAQCVNYQGTVNSQ
jgi:hypothetical protein